MAGLIRKFTKQIFITCNVCLSICMLLLYTLRFASPVYSWFINLVALLLPFFILLQIGFLVFWLVVKRKLAWIPVVTLFLCWGLISSLVGFHLSADKKRNETDGFRVSTWNTHMFNFFENKGKLDAEMVKEAGNFHADVLAVQEFVFSLDSTSPISLEKTKNRLGFRYVVAANDRAFGVHTNLKQKNERYHPFCVAFFSNHPVLQWKKVQSSKEYNYTFLWADILVKKDTFRFFNIHLQSMHFAKDDYEFIENIDQQGVKEVQRNGRNIIRKMKNAYVMRAAQARVVKDEIDKSPYPVIVCGDMNDVPNSYAYQLISRNLHDSYMEKGFGIGRTFQFLSPTLRIDYILHSKELELEQVQIIRPSPGDHNPVIADFRLPGQ